MNPRYKSALFILLVLAVSASLAFFLRGTTVALFDPKGPIGAEESHLIVIATRLMLVAIVPMYILLFTFAWRYRAGNPKARYDPNLDHHPAVGFMLWAIPAVIIFVLAIINWKSTHALDPYRPIVSDAKPLTIQVIALQWKWLFIYPEQNIATLNFVQFPERTPLNFELTADAPMNSFWIPQLGGQMYAMAGMSTKLHLMADEVGEFRGSAAEISGAGFAGMTFIAKSTSEADFDAWVRSVKQSGAALTLDAYNELARPSENNPPALYASAEDDLYAKIIMKFMAPSAATNTERVHG